MMSLSELAGRCEKATGHDVMLDIAIHYATEHRTISVPPFTGSIDAAAELVPEWHKWAVYGGGYATVAPWNGSEADEEIDLDHIKAATPALALCAAALKARAASGIETEGHDPAEGHGAEHESPARKGTPK